MTPPGSRFSACVDERLLSPLSPYRFMSKIQAIDFNAADTEVVTALEALPNIGSVAVTRQGPDGQLGYSWSITFVENPGYFPAGSGDVSLLLPDCSGLVGVGADCWAEEVSRVQLMMVVFRAHLLLTV